MKYPTPSKAKFFAAAEHADIGDPAYCEKMWDQGIELQDREEFLRKVGLFIAWVASGNPKAVPIFGEIAGLVNDRGAMRQHLTAAEQVERDEYGDRITE